MSWRLLAGAIPAIFLLACGWFGRGYYDGYNRQEKEIASHVEFLHEQKVIAGVYGPIQAGLPISDAECGPAVTHALDGLRRAAKH